MTDIITETGAGYICPAYNSENVVEGPEAEPLERGKLPALDVSVTVTFRRKSNPVAWAVAAGRGMVTVSESDEWVGGAAEDDDVDADLMEMHAYLARKVLRKAIARQLDENCRKCRVVRRCDYTNQLFDKLVSLAAE